MEEWQNWYFKDDKVIYNLKGDMQITMPRCNFEIYVKEMDYNIFHIQVAEDDFKPYTPTQEEYDKEEKEFFDNYFKSQQR